jgi:spore coat polysaccharide biosynthesis predicted glycosyltransferase SpsG
VEGGERVTPPRTLFVCRGSAGDGLGHVIRTREVVAAADSLLDPTLLVVGDDLPTALLDGSSFRWSIVPDERALVEATSGVDWDAVVFDAVSFGNETVRTLSGDALKASLSPIFSHLPQMDLAFNRTRYDGEGEAVDGPGIHYGLEYAIVRRDCRRIATGVFADHLDEDIIAIAISMGGADAPNRTLDVLDALRPIESPATFWVLLGEGYAHSYRSLVDSVQRDRRHEVILAKTNRSMWRILRNCSLAILAGGVTSYEAVFAGLPSVNVLADPADRFLIREPVELGAAFEGGTFADPDLTTLRETVERLIGDREELLRVHRASRGLVDGRGARRVVETIAGAVTSASTATLEQV